MTLPGGDPVELQCPDIVFRLAAADYRRSAARRSIGLETLREMSKVDRQQDPTVLISGTGQSRRATVLLRAVIAIPSGQPWLQATYKMGCGHSDDVHGDSRYFR